MLEREYKFAVDREWAVPSFDDVCTSDAAEVFVQTATYYDTPDLRLARAGASIRYRDDDGWTVKLPVNDHARHALVRAEFGFGGSAGVPPADALELVAARVRTARLEPVARLQTHRTARVLSSLATDGDGAAGGPIGTLTDDVCTVLEGRERVTFREIELEIAPEASEQSVKMLVERLREAGASDADPTPKVARALGAPAAAPPDIVVLEVHRPTTVEAVVRHAISEAVLKLVTSDPVIRIGEDVEGVHQARVATRRLRSHLRTFRDLLDGAWSEPLRAELGWLGAELGAVRDADVMLSRMRARVAALDAEDHAAAAPIIDRLVNQQQDARTVLLDGLRSQRYLSLLDRLVDAAQRPHVTMRIAGDDEDVLRLLVRRPWKKLRSAVKALPDPAPDAALHAVRIRAKRARYAAEVVEPAFGAHAGELARALTRVQDVLGDHQDAVVAGAWLRTTARTLPDPASVYVAGELAAAERAAAEASRNAWPKAWRAANRKRLRRWL